MPDIKSISTVYASPTETTKKVLDSIAAGTGLPLQHSLDLTTVSMRKSAVLPDNEDSLILLGLPVYEEHIPEFVVEAISGLSGKGRSAVICVTFGNIGYGMALKDLYALCRHINLHVIAAAACVGEHSFSSSKAGLAEGRPDGQDQIELENFGAEISKRLQSGSDAMNANEIPTLEIDKLPGRLPLMSRVLPAGSAKRFTKKPKTNEHCISCGLCIGKCPMEAISPDLSIDNTKCLRCFACVKLCPVEGRDIIYTSGIVRHFLKRKDRTRMQNSFFLIRN